MKKKGDFAIVDFDGNGNFVRYTRIQIQGVLDDLYTYNDKLGVVYNGNTITLRLWAPTAQSVELNLFSDATTTSSSKTQKAQMSFDQNTGIWSASSTVNDWQYLVEFFFFFFSNLYSFISLYIINNLILLNLI